MVLYDLRVLERGRPHARARKNCVFKRDDFGEGYDRGGITSVTLEVASRALIFLCRSISVTRRVNHVLRTNNAYCTAAHRVPGGIFLVNAVKKLEKRTVRVQYYNNDEGTKKIVYAYV